MSFWPETPISVGMSFALVVLIGCLLLTCVGKMKMRLVRKVLVGLGVGVTLSVAALLVASANADAQDSFDMTQNGRAYRCQAVSPSPGTGGSAVDCADRAYNGPFNRDQSMQLCAGSFNTGPADCAIRAYAGAFNLDQALSLCTGAYNTGPVDCANRAYSGPFNIPQALQLCSGIGTTALADCAIRAYAGPYTIDESIRLCRSPQRPLIERALDQILGADGKNPGLMLEKAFAKATREKN